MKHLTNEGGFTLLEVIIALVVVSMMGAYLVQMSSSTRYSAMSVGWFQDETNLQGLMERIVGEYKGSRELANPSGAGASLTTLKSYVETTAPYAGKLLASETGFVSFNVSGSNYLSSWPPTANPTSQNPVLIITFRSGDQKVAALFTQ